MHVCTYCGIEYDQAETMCPACGHKTNKIISPFKEEKKETKKEDIKESFKKPDDHKIEVKEKEAFYKDALAKLEKSLFKEKKEDKKDKRKEEILIPFRWCVKENYIVPVKTLLFLQIFIYYMVCYQLFYPHPGIRV